MTPSRPKVVAISGGVGGARLVHGLARALDDDLTVIVNTGDDFVHWGLTICPDLDTVMYTLADLAHEERGWGLAEESFHALAMVRRLGGDDWFQLGDRDLATHIVRSEALRRGDTLTAVTSRLVRALGIAVRVLPMTDAPRPTVVDTTTHGTLGFQDWLVKHRAPPVSAVRFAGTPAPAPGVLAAIAACDVVVIGPSNPYVSVDPIFTLPGVREALSEKQVVAVSPIVSGRAVKGPLAEMIPALTGEAPSAHAIASHYGPLLTAMVVERGDEGALSLPTLATDTIMKSRADARRLATELLAFVEGLPSRTRERAR